MLHFTARQADLQVTDSKIMKHCFTIWFTGNGRGKNCKVLNCSLNLSSSKAMEVKASLQDFAMKAFWVPKIVIAYFALGGKNGHLLPPIYGGLSQAFNVNFLLCLHFDTISVLLFSVFSGSARQMVSFSWRHKSQLFPPHWNGYPLLLIFHVILCSIFWSFRECTYLLRAVLWRFFSCLRSDWCWLYLDLNGPSVNP